MVTEQSWLDQSSAAFTTSTIAPLDLVLAFAPLQLLESLESGCPSVRAWHPKRYILYTMHVYRTKKDIVASQLREAIISGDLAPGSRLPLQDLAKRLKLSLTPIREALPLLEAEGFVTQVPHKGAVVTPLDTDEVLELYTIRSAIEGLAARYGVAALSPNAIEQMEALLITMDGVNDNWDRYLPVDRKFHSVLYKASGSRRWLSTIETLWKRSLRYMITSSVVVGADSLREDHLDLLEACRRRDAETAEHVIHAHLGKSQSQLLERLRASQ